MDIGVTVHAPHSTEHEKKKLVSLLCAVTPPPEIVRCCPRESSPSSMSTIAWVAHRPSPAIVSGKWKPSSCSSVLFQYSKFQERSAGGSGSDAQRVSSQGRHCVGERHRWQSSLLSPRFEFWQCNSIALVRHALCSNFLHYIVARPPLSTS